ncbi:hypothetical protein CLAFUW4_09200 [Fulvia fulva]|uniref:Uncharacterized protein n=1 Tax=Passalora fulva TaxID=5499 RepID=A0A9Q8PFT6_PASFU|nr:uncharacterized protein CLAFUR5_09301 [Fulvia fulva]KAK4613338.1 hypothetical protein CLAFUR4_09206 [Fulvia fulva]KAK4614449.1 hypothetical protein CLAFUR0_09198 [Fulvia fulva]UJO21690.1 hypothetical protein CLAFUR5_09301 [Fulvia fulva]WPV19883.1 hypothetical protein CLAFUW4_09200 [Fulvia fulva]WPV35265.1 hypothetical protein CLAFUW7_09201 [Fulvia fulva]
MLMKRNNATSITFDGVPTQVEATLRQQIASSKTGSPNPVTSLENAREKVQVIAELVKAGEASARVALLAMSQEWVASHLDSKSIVIDHECEQGIARGVEAIEASFEELSKEIEGLKKKATGAGIVDSAV